jgi:hypothetical protein
MKYNNLIFIIKQTIMSLRNKLLQQGSELSELDGATPSTPNFRQSTLHKKYSTDGVPNAMNVAPENGVLPSPSILDRGNIPSSQRYLNNLPG